MEELTKTVFTIEFEDDVSSFEATRLLSMLSNLLGRNGHTGIIWNGAKYGDLNGVHKFTTPVLPSQPRVFNPQPKPEKGKKK